ncbi:alpha/beta hydrolase [Sphingomonas sp. FW199]|uniref:alpha/beta hydrolase n=1 Tax=Sphingomonas sp. FW199 TaxID=3400217 RepID=UPI003CE9EDA2
MNRVATITKARFPSAEAGVDLVGDLYAPLFARADSTAFVIIGPMTFQKEQAPTQYARRLAAMGHSALVFDPRYRGESGGELRAWENPFHKVADIISATAFLRNQHGVNPDRVIGLGICQGSSEMLRAVAEDDMLKAGVTLAGHYRDHEGDIAWLTEAGYAARLAQGQAAKAKYDATGEIDYVAAVDEVDMNVGMPGKFVWDWYHVWADKGLWENRYAVMSDADLLPYESISAAQTLNKPYLLIHSDNSFLPDAARRHFEAMPSARKTLIWDGDTPHLSYYDQPEVLDRTAASIDKWVADL